MTGLKLPHLRRPVTARGRPDATPPRPPRKRRGLVGERGVVAQAVIVGRDPREAGRPPGGVCRPALGDDQCGFARGEAALGDGCAPSCMPPPRLDRADQPTARRRRRGCIESATRPRPACLPGAIGWVRATSQRQASRRRQDPRDRTRYLLTIGITGRVSYAERSWAGHGARQYAHATGSVRTSRAIASRGRANPPRHV